MKVGLAFASSIGIDGATCLEICKRAEAAIRRAVKLADGYFPGEGDVERLGNLLGRVRSAAEAAGRDPSSIEINAMFGAQMADPARGAEERAALGVNRIMIPALFFAGDDGLDRLSEFGENVIGQLPG